MSGCHQTTGESATSGAGGWINGLGDKDELLGYHKHLREFFEAIAGRERLEPHRDIARGTPCLAGPGKTYVLYTPGGHQHLSLEPGTYLVSCFNPRTGAYQIVETTSESDWQSREPHDRQDWVFLLEKIS
jgi:hypothetical protein